MRRGSRYRSNIERALKMSCPTAVQNDGIIMCSGYEALEIGSVVEALCAGGAGAQEWWAAVCEQHQLLPQALPMDGQATRSGGRHRTATRNCYKA